MTRKQLQLFFKKYPSVTQAGIAREAGISNMLLSYILSGERTITAKTAEKLKPVINKYDGC